MALPRRGAFGGAESEELASRVSAALRPSSERQRIVVGGHSRGGVVASALVASHTRSIDGLVLIGTSHPRDVDLSGFGGAVTKIVGTMAWPGTASSPWTDGRRSARRSSAKS